MAETADQVQVSANIVSETTFKPKSGQEVALRASYVTALPLFPYNELDTKSGSDTLKYQKPARNPIVRTALDIIEAAAFSQNSTFVPQNDYKKNPWFQELDDRIIDLCQNQLDGLSYSPWSNVQRQLLDSAMTYGFAIAEVNWVTRTGLKWVDSIKLKPSYNFDIYINRFDEIESLRYYQALPQAFLDPRKFIIAPWPELSEGNYYGISELQSILTDIDIIEELERKRAEGVSYAMVRPIVHKYVAHGRGDIETASALKAVADVSSGGVIQLPTKTDDSGQWQPSDMIDVLPSRCDGEALHDVRDIIDQITARINRRFGIADDLGTTKSSVGSRAKAEVEAKNIFLNKVRRCQKWEEDVVNRQIVPMLVGYNFRQLPSDYKMPRYQFQYADEDTLQNKADYWIELVKNKIVPADSQQMRRELKLENEEEATDGSEAIQPFPIAV